MYGDLHERPLIVQQWNAFRRRRLWKRLEKSVNVCQFRVRDDFAREGRHLSCRLADIPLKGGEGRRVRADARAGASLRFPAVALEAAIACKKLLSVLRISSRGILRSRSGSRSLRSGDAMRNNQGRCYQQSRRDDSHTTVCNRSVHTGLLTAAA